MKQKVYTNIYTIRSKMNGMKINVKKRLEGLEQKILEIPLAKRILGNLTILALTGVVFSFISFFYDFLGFKLAFSILVFSTILPGIINTAYKRSFGGSNIVDKNPGIVEELDINFPVYLYVYSTDEYTDNQARYTPIQDRIEINSDTVDRYYMGNISKKMR